jgi:hypothetical protein
MTMRPYKDNGTAYHGGRCCSSGDIRRYVRLPHEL